MVADESIKLTSTQPTHVQISFQATTVFILWLILSNVAHLDTKKASRHAQVKKNIIITIMTTFLDKTQAHQFKFSV